MGNCNGCFAGIIGTSEAAKTDKPSDLMDCKALANACQKGDVKEVSRLLLKADPCWADESFFNYTPLHRAAGQGHTEVVRLLLADERVNGGNVDMRSTSDETPLIMAARGRRAEICQMLLEMGADPEAKTNYKGNLARSARSYLVEAGYGALL
ncbi:unnamed protein product [Amoebophrya sp. A25]|nr:unnamed protein product [Amoebophrya sp. A25]|eukprot:GSA25T00014872001.1